jgi:hypothetical protein
MDEEVKKKWRRAACGKDDAETDDRIYDLDEDTSRTKTPTPLTSGGGSRENAVRAEGADRVTR